MENFQSPPRPSSLRQDSSSPPTRRRDEAFRARGHCAFDHLQRICAHYRRAKGLGVDCFKLEPFQVHTHPYMVKDQLFRGLQSAYKVLDVQLRT